MASLTVATNTSPIEAYRRLEPPSTLMHSTSLAPELSATRSRDSCWIIAPRSEGAVERNVERSAPKAHDEPSDSTWRISPRGSPRALQHFDDPPPLQLR